MIAFKRIYNSAIVLIWGLLIPAFASAADEGLGTIATHVVTSFSKIAKLITAGSYLAGAAFAVGAIMKFKQHKDNPTQNPIGTPIALVFIAAALMFLPALYHAAGITVFGTGISGNLSGVTF